MRKKLLVLIVAVIAIITAVIVIVVNSGKEKYIPFLTAKENLISQDAEREISMGVGNGMCEARYIRIACGEWKDEKHNGVFFITEEEQIDRILAELEGIRYSDKVSSDELDNETDMSQKRVYINAYYPLSIIHFDSFDTGKGIYSYTCVEPSLHEIGKEGLYPNQLGDYKTKKSAEDIFNITEEILDEYIRYITVEDIKELIIEKEEVDFLDFGTFYNSYMESSGIYGYRVMPLEGEKYNLKIKYEEGSYPIHESDGRGYWGRETLFTIDGIVLSDANGNSLDLLHSEEADIDEFISGDK